MTKNEWVTCVVALRSAYGASFKMDDAAIELWYTMLNDLSGGSVMAGIAHMIKTQEAFPSIAQIRKHAEGPATDPMALWGEVQSKAHASIWPPFYEGVSHPVEWSDPLIPKALAAIGGAQAYLECNTEAMPAMRKHFCLAYQSLKENAQRAETFMALGVSPNMDYRIEPKVSIARLESASGGIGRAVK